MIFISKTAFWNLFDFIVLCALVALLTAFIIQKNQIRSLNHEVFNIKFQMKALHQDMFQLENQLLQKQFVLKKKFEQVTKDNRPEIHIHGNGEGSVKVFNATGEIVVETIEELKEVRTKR